MNISLSVKNFMKMNCGEYYSSHFIFVVTSNAPNKLEGSFLADYSTLVYCLKVRPEPTQMKHLSNAPTYQQTLAQALIFADKAGTLPEWSPIQDSTLLVGSQPCLQILDKGGRMAVINTQAYYIAATITAAKFLWYWLQMTLNDTNTKVLKFMKQF